MLHLDQLHHLHPLLLLRTSFAFCQLLVLLLLLLLLLRRPDLVLVLPLLLPSNPRQPPPLQLPLQSTPQST
jgi:hypothetical protein